MKFETRNIGVFDLLSVQIVASEVFDAGRLRQETLRMLERGSRRLVIDLGGVDYLYSDSINALVSLNRRMLESSGRMGILVPSAKVYDILVRAGLENIMRLYRSEADLLNDSRELMRQSSAWTRPAELLSAASASQMISASVVTPKNPSENRETSSPGQRVPRKRVGSRVELRPRHRGGRSLDQELPTAEFQLPPQLPTTPGESTTLRTLSQDSSAFDQTGNASQSSTRASLPYAPAPEPTVFQVPETPREESYRGTDPWLLTMPANPHSPSSIGDGRPSAPEAASSSFLPKISPIHPVDPQSNFPTSLHWDHVQHPVPQPPPEPPKVSPSRPVEAGSSSGISSRIGNEPSALDWLTSQPIPQAPVKNPPPPASSTAKPATPTSTGAPPTDIQSVIFYNDPPIKPPGSGPGSKFEPPPLETQPLVWSERASVPPSAPPMAAPPPAALQPPAASKSAAESFKGSPSELDAWFGGPSTANAPFPKPLASKGSASDSDSNHSKTGHSSSLSNPGSSMPAPFAARTAARPDAPGIESWFETGKSPAPSHPKPVPTPAPAPSSWEIKPSTPAAAPAPRIPPTSSPLDNWITPAPAPNVDSGTSNRQVPTGGTMWLDTNKPVRKPISAPKEPTAYLDLDDLSGEPRSKKTLWIALIALAVIALVGLALFFLGGSTSNASEVPNGTSIEDASVPTPQITEASAPVEPEPEPEAETPVPAAATTKANPSKAKSTPLPAAEPEPVPAVVEDHAPVKIFVTSRPSGATLMLDGYRVGSTPCEVTFKRQGKLEFTLAGYRQQTKDIDPEDTRGTISVQMLADGGSGGNVGQIYISSAPVGAEIVVGGKVVGKTPRLLELPIGSQKVTVRSGVLSRSRSLQIQSGTNIAEYFSL